MQPLKSALRSKQLSKSLSGAEPEKLKYHERESSILRHSVVERCFYNLKLMSQLLPEKSEDEAFLQEFKNGFTTVGDVEKKIEDYFNWDLGDGLTLRKLFSHEYWAVKRAVSSIKTASMQIDILSQSKSLKEFSKKIPAAVDSVMESLKAVDIALREFKIDVGHLVAEVLGLHKHALAKDGIEIKPPASSSDVPSFYGDRTRLRDAISEVLRNAHKHAFPQDHKGQKQISVSISRKGNGVVVTIEDNGVGIDLARLEKMNKNRGSQIIRTTIENHNGTINWEPTSGGGTIVTIEIPV